MHSVAYLQYHKETKATWPMVRVGFTGACVEGWWRGPFAPSGDMSSPIANFCVHAFVLILSVQTWPLLRADEAEMGSAAGKRRPEAEKFLC